MKKKCLTQVSILKKAEYIIYSQGLNKCTIRNLAKELNVAVGTIYNYYESRESLLKDLLFMSWDNTIRRLNSLAENEDLLLKDAIRRGLNIIKEDIRNRGGIGQEIGAKKPRVMFAPIRIQVIESLKSLLMKLGSLNSEESLERARWIYAIVMDEISYNGSIEDEKIESIVNALVL